ncbi:MAG: hypothetical protein A07HR60_01501 [uncultured archaeon A07HR60]|nr:MAG: hypothetical protein J07HR59_01624 [Halorubrum sp. J07HR59]ESS11446.1 MAG: hypothetical protein A07HR60_01501 [uncultured archaeon A07HR60]
MGQPNRPYLLEDKRPGPRARLEDSVGLCVLIAMALWPAMLHLQLRNRW